MADSSSSPGRSILLTLLALPILLYLGIAVALWLGQEMLLFPGLWLLRDNNAWEPGWREVIPITRPDGSTLPVVFSGDGHDRLVLLTHGNAEWIGDMERYAEVLNEAGWAFAAMGRRRWGGDR